MQRTPESIDLIKQDYLTYITKPELLNINAF
jgi:hypothetical protein